MSSKLLTSISPLSLSDIDDSIYPLRYDPPSHIASLPRTVATIFSSIKSASMEAFRAAREGSPPPSSIWTEIFIRFREIYKRYCTTNTASHPADALRRIVGEYILELQDQPFSHHDLNKRLLYCAYWCCLGHASTCSSSSLYEQVCCRFFTSFGAGEVPPYESIRYWNTLYGFASEDPEFFVRNAAAAVYLKNKNL
ncbi:virion protein US10 [Canid alphaherpesvirus 1]|uniref:Virion protein US10 homolog n=1 Tax=Canid alphaherpesvirus 1 TaxID=170325 RepID=A0A172DT19_9ALPH|nr:virion protein US10 [Canid alphaherpesvirus 1]YP_009252301.1 virion protein US10 [Canid alphaherpesvirus 1]ALL26095.1 virion protein US10 [Canid alphaherpesvirus 1]ALL26106.1 virion protein US10 [Canid alphaherpesvirus 1]